MVVGQFEGLRSFRSLSDQTVAYIGAFDFLSRRLNLSLFAQTTQMMPYSNCFQVESIR